MAVALFVHASNKRVAFQGGLGSLGGPMDIEEGAPVESGYLMPS